MKLFLVIALGVLANGKYNLHDLLQELAESEISGKNAPDTPVSGSYGRPKESMLSKTGESKISWENQMSVPMWVQYACDRQLITSDTTKYSEDFSVAYGEFTASGSASQEETKEYMYSLVDKTGKYSKVGPKDYLEEKAPSCVDNVVYATILNFGSTGSPNYFLNLSGMGEGEQIIVSGNINSPHSEKNDDICFGDDCGCYNGKCWSYCSFGSNWCYTTKGHTQDYNYVYCGKDRECMPDWHCAGPCTIFDTR